MRIAVADASKPLLLMALLLAACDSQGSPAAASADPSTPAPGPAVMASSGVKACDAYLEVATACLGKLPKADRKLLQISIQQYRQQAAQATSEAAKQAVAIGCEAELESLREDNTCP